MSMFTVHSLSYPYVYIFSFIYILHFNIDLTLHSMTNLRLYDTAYNNYQKIGVTMYDIHSLKLKHNTSEI